MGKSKVIYGSNVLIDLTSDTVTPETLCAGVTAHNAAGEPVRGTASYLGIDEDGYACIYEEVS